MKKTNAKRILAAALAGMMALSLSACGEQGQERQSCGSRQYKRHRNHPSHVFLLFFLGLYYIPHYILKYILKYLLTHI